MKKTFIAIMLTAASVGAWAQADASLSQPSQPSEEGVGKFTLIPKVGLNYSTVSLDTWPGKSSGIEKPDISGLVGVAIGVEGEYRAQPWLGVSAALLYSMQGRKYDDQTALQNAVRSGLLTDDKAAMISKEYHHFLNIPLTANFYVMKGLAIRTGLQLGYLFHQSGTLETPKDDYPKHNISGSPGKVDLSIPVGVSYALDNGLQFDLRYNHGLTKVSWYDNLLKEKNRTVQLTVGYRLDTAKIFKRSSASKQ